MTSNLVLSNAFLVVLGFLPSLIWLFFFLKRDNCPEPEYMIGKTFLMGIIISPLAILFQFGFIQLAGFFNSSWGPGSMSFILWAAFIEEILKFLAVVLIALRSPEFDQPVDAMIYMISAAMGFAAIENILFLFNMVPQGNVFQATTVQNISAIETLGLRFLGANLLHALSSAIIGYFLAMSWFFQHHKKKLIVMGLVIGTIFHFSFNVFLSSFETPRVGLIFSTTLLVIMAFLVYILFDKIKERHAKLSNVQLAGSSAEKIFLLK